MCLALPARVLTLNPDGTATVTLGGVKKAISVELLEQVAEGDYVVVHTGFAISRLDPVDAEKTIAAWRAEVQ